MDPFQSLLRLLPQMLAKDLEPRSASDLLLMTEASVFDLEAYYLYWQDVIRRAANSSQQPLSNGWAFASLNGLAQFEAQVRTDPEIRSIYFNTPGDVGQALDKIALALPRRPIGGMVFYGYGNLVRESHFVERAHSSKLLKNQCLYLIDCSVFYHVFAQSKLNPLRRWIPERRIKPILLDYLDDPEARQRLKDIRQDLNVTQPVLHFFLGNKIGRAHV